MMSQIDTLSETETWLDTRAYRVGMIDLNLRRLWWLGRSITQLIAEYVTDSEMEQLHRSCRVVLAASVDTHRYRYELQIWGQTMQTMLVADLTKILTHSNAVRAHATVRQETKPANLPADLVTWLKPLVCRAATANVKNRAQSKPRPDVIQMLTAKLAAQILKRLSHPPD